MKSAAREIAEAEEDDGLGEAALDLQVLAAQGRGHGLSGPRTGGLRKRREVAPVATRC